MRVDLATVTSNANIFLAIVTDLSNVEESVVFHDVPNRYQSINAFVRVVKRYITFTLMSEEEKSTGQKMVYLYDFFGKADELDTLTFQRTLGAVMKIVILLILLVLVLGPLFTSITSMNRIVRCLC